MGLNKISSWVRARRSEWKVMPRFHKRAIIFLAITGCVVIPINAYHNSKSMHQSSKVENAHRCS